MYHRGTRLVLPIFAVTQHRSVDIERAISCASAYVFASQQSDGSWYDSWAICFHVRHYFRVEEPENRGADLLDKPSGPQSLRLGSL